MKPLTFQKSDVEFDAEGAKIRAWLYRPDSSSDVGAAVAPFAAVVMAGGFSCVKEMHLDKYAAAFAGAGCVV